MTINYIHGKISNMVKDILSTILEYIDYLKYSLHLQISICSITECFAPYMHILQPYNSHQNAYCTYIKSNEQTKWICVEKQKNVIAKGMDGAFYGCCWTGVEEYVFPIKSDQKVLGFISVSGYRGQNDMSLKKMNHFSKKYHIDKEVLMQHYNQLNTNVPPIHTVRPLIMPLCLLFEMLYTNIPKKPKIDGKESSLYASILNFLCFNYTKNLTLHDIAKEMNYSESYIRQLFHKKSNHTIAHYLTILRMKRAKELLLNESIPIGQIAYEVGYTDANYFSNVFRKEVGMSPTTYRKKQNMISENSILDQFCDI